ncbi:MAG: hypothetical protein Q8T08_07340 [Ignavibacteria bacterium]|nr:hypothetical protein [Ignavibacteria bacterium]
MKIERSNKLHLHYYFSDKSHGFNAIVRNECEKEILQIFKEIASNLDLKLLIEAEPPKDGGFVEIWKFIGDNANQVTVIVSAIAIFLSRIPVQNKKLTQLQIENLELDNEIKKEELKKLRLKSVVQSEITRELIAKVVDLLNLNYRIIWRRSNFYKKITQYGRIEKVSSQRFLNETPVGNDRTNQRAEFSKFILESDELPEITIEGAVIDLISPVLKSGRFQWKGFYNQEIISFEMLDYKFSKMVQLGQVKMNNKAAISTRLKFKRKIDENGLIKAFKHKVLTVIEFSIDGQEQLTDTK